MTSVFTQALEAVRVWLGWTDSSGNRLHSRHGWLLPSAADIRALAFDRALAMTPALVPAPIPAVRGRRR